MRVGFATALLALAGCVAEDSDFLYDPPHDGCPTCVLEFHESWSSSPRNEDAILPSNAVLLGSDVLLGLDDWLVLMDDGGGTMRRIQRDGDGPGEFRSPKFVSPYPGGGILIGERDRLTLLNAEFEFISVARLPLLAVNRDVIVLNDSSIVIPAPLGAGNTRTHLHRISLEGELLSSWDEGGSEARISSFLGPGWNGSIWSSPVGGASAFELDRWNPMTGEREARITRTPEWFGDWHPPTRQSGSETRQVTHPDPPEVIALWQMSERHLIVVTRIADRRWASTVAGSGYHRRFDSIVEVIDVESGEVLGARIFDEFVSGFASDGRLVFYTEDRSGYPRVSLVSVRLVEPAPSSSDP